jgi:hypothetical protein
LETTGYLAHDKNLEFSDLHAEIGEKIHQCINTKKFSEIQPLIKDLGRVDELWVRYSILDRYHYAWREKVGEMVKDWKTIRGLGLL